MDYLINLTIFFAIYAILGISLNLVVGYTGLLSVAEAAFYGVGAYVTAILLTHFGINFFVALIISVFISAFSALIIGIVLSKFSGDYYAIGSLGFNVIMLGIFLNWQDLTNGSLGISGITKPSLFGISFSSNFTFLILSLLFLLVSYLVSRLIINSAFGKVLKAIREDEKAIQIFGYNTIHYKLAIFMIGAGLAAIAGSLYASYITYIDPTSFTLTTSIFILAIIILGGLANLRGSILGALFLILLPELLRFVGFPDAIAAQIRQAIYGLILVGLMLYRPQGLIGEYKL